MFNHLIAKETWEVSVRDSWDEHVIGMGGEEWFIPINVGETGIAKVYKDGSVKLKLDNITEPPNGGKLVCWVSDTSLLDWNNQVS